MYNSKDNILITSLKGSKYDKSADLGILTSLVKGHV